MTNMSATPDNHRPPTQPSGTYITRSPATPVSERWVPASSSPGGALPGAWTTSSCRQLTPRVLRQTTSHHSSCAQIIERRASGDWSPTLVCGRRAIRGRRSEVTWYSMSRRASILAKQQRSRPKVRFPDDLVFLDNIRENDLDACKVMLRRASLKIDINALNDAGLTPLHQAVLDGNLAAVKLLVEHGANVNERDADTWTPLHAACAEGHTDIVRYLLTKGANKEIMSCEGERPLDLVDSADLHTIGAMLETEAPLGLSSHNEDSSPSSSPAKRRPTGKSD